MLRLLLLPHSEIALFHGERYRSVVASGQRERSRFPRLQTEEGRCLDHHDVRLSSPLPRGGDLDRHGQPGGRGINQIRY